MSEPPPHRTGAPPREVTLTGCVFPWDNATGQPVLLVMPGADGECLPCFTTPAKLQATLERAGVPYDAVKHIDDGWDFLASVHAGGVRVILDPWYTPEGRVRFQAVTPAGNLAAKAEPGVAPRCGHGILRSEYCPGCSLEGVQDDWRRRDDPDGEGYG